MERKKDINNMTDWAGESDYLFPASDFVKNEKSKLEVLGAPIEPEEVSLTMDSVEKSRESMGGETSDSAEISTKEQTLKSGLPEEVLSETKDQEQLKEPEKVTASESSKETEAERKEKVPKRKAEKKTPAKKKAKKAEVEPPVRKRSGVEKAVSAIIFIILLGISLRFAAHTLENREGSNKVRPFFELETSPDVLLVGTSHMSYGIISPILWNDYGIASYNLGASQATIPMSYWRIMMALEYSDPKVIVLDCSKMKEDVKTSENVGPLYWGFDGMPLTKTKIQALQDLLNDPYYEAGIENGTIDERYFQGQDQRKLFPMLFNFITYHTRWKYFTPEFLENTENQLMGSLYMSNVGEAITFPTVREDKTLEEDSVGTAYLRAIVRVCQERNIQLVLTYLPFSANVTRQKEAHSAALLADELGVPMINFLDLDVVDYDTDLSDQSHLNAAGGKKVTDFIGNYLSEQFRLTDRRGDSAYSAWDDAAAAYDAVQLNALKNAEDLESYLMLLDDPAYDAVIEFYEPTAFLSGKIPALLRSLGVNPDDIAEDSQYVLVRGGEEASILYGARGDATEYETVLGTFLSVSKEDTSAQYSIGGIVLNETGVLSDLPDEDSALVRICVMEHGNPENVIDTIEFCRTETQKVNVSASRKSGK